MLSPLECAIVCVLWRGRARRMDSFVFLLGRVDHASVVGYEVICMMGQHLPERDRVPERVWKWLAAIFNDFVAARVDEAS